MPTSAPRPPAHPLCLCPACRAALGQLPLVAVLFRSVPVVHHLLGPMDAQPRVRRQVQRQAKRKEPVGELALKLCMLACSSLFVAAESQQLCPPGQPGSRPLRNCTCTAAQLQRCPSPHRWVAPADALRLPAWLTWLCNLQRRPGFSARGGGGSSGPGEAGDRLQHGGHVESAARVRRQVRAAVANPAARWRGQVLLWGKFQGIWRCCKGVCQCY